MNKKLLALLLALSLSLSLHSLRRRWRREHHR